MANNLEKSPGLQALHFPSKTEKEEGKEALVFPCLFCDLQFDSRTQEKFLRHILLEHKFVIADVKLVVNLPSYIRYWRDRFKISPIKEFCSVIQTNTSETDQGPREFYYLLCDLLPEDKTLRENLQRERLETVLQHHKREREDQTFSRMCLFCRKQFTGKREDLFSHMLKDHNFSVGQPDNIVFGSEFLDILEQKLKKLQCLYCEKTFKSWEVLKEHMRKKQHKKINPKNSVYDKFYIINYLELGKTWETLETEVDHFLPDSEQTEDWNDWKEEEGLGAVCLFCDVTSTDFNTLNSHMSAVHTFDLPEIKKQMNLNFYQQVKLINFIRREVLNRKCYFCKQIFESPPELSHHLKSTGHVSQIPDASQWDQPQYYFSTYENDNLLSIIDDDDDESEACSSEVNVVPEDFIVSSQSPVLCDELTRLSLLNEGS